MCYKRMNSRWKTKVNLLYNILYIVDKFYTFVNCCVLREVGKTRMKD